MNLGSSGAWRLNVLLAAAVAALCLFVYLKPGGHAPAEHALATLKPDEVSAIRIERAGSEPIVLQKKLDAWRITAPLAARADLERVQRLLAIVEATSSTRLPATDLARYGLERPEARLAIGAQGFDFGMVNPLSHEQYVLTGNAVYPVSLRYGAALPTGAGDLADKRLLAAGETPVRFELKDFTVERRDGKWLLDQAGVDLSQDDFQKWADNWRHAGAVRVAPYVTGKPLGAIELQFQNGGKLPLSILAREPELALLRPDENLVYYFLSGQARRLLAPPGTARPAEVSPLDAKPKSR